MSNRPKQLAERIKRIRLPQKTIAERSGLDETTVGRALGGEQDSRNSTLDRIEEVVVADERELLRELIARHGCSLITPISPDQLAAPPAA